MRPKNKHPRRIQSTITHKPVSDFAITIDESYPANVFVVNVTDTKDDTHIGQYIFDPKFDISEFENFTEVSRLVHDARTHAESRNYVFNLEQLIACL